MAATFTAKRYPRIGVDSKVYIYFEAGQSNSNGFGSTAFEYSFTNTQTWFKSDIEDGIDNGSWQPFEFGTNTSNPGTDTRPDPSIYFAKAWEQQYPNSPLRIIQTAKGATGFLSNSNGPWNINGFMRDSFFNYHVAPALASLQAEFDEVWALPFFWVHGERDGLFENSSDQYQANLSQFIGDWRSLINLPNAPVVIALLHENLDPDSYIYRDVVRSRQESFVAADSQAFSIELSSYPMLGDNTHYPDSSYQAMGEAYLDLAQKIGSRRLTW